MENDIALIASGYLGTRIVVLLAFGYLFYRFLRPAPVKVRIETKDDMRSNTTKYRKRDTDWR